jgi:hypothetical protein
MIGNKQYWLFEKLCPGKGIELAIKFETQNIRSDTNEWKLIFDRETTSILKSLEIIDPFNQCSVSYNCIVAYND